MSSPRKDRLEARLGHWQRYAALTGSAIALATGAPTPSLAGINEPVLRSVKVSDCGAELAELLDAVSRRRGVG